MVVSVFTSARHPLDGRGAPESFGVCSMLVSGLLHYKWLMSCVSVVALIGCSAAEANKESTTQLQAPEKLQDGVAYCTVDSYRNNNDECVSLPRLSAVVPIDATARCRMKVGDEHWYSFSRTRQGTCANHGGVVNWCADGRCEEKP